MVSTWVSGPVPACSTAQVRAVFHSHSSYLCSHHTSLPQNASLSSAAPCRAQGPPPHGIHGQHAQPSGHKLPREHRKSPQSLQAQPRPACPETPIPLQVQPTPSNIRTSNPAGSWDVLLQPQVTSVPMSPVLTLPWIWRGLGASLSKAGHFTALSLCALSQNPSYLLDHGSRASLPSMDSAMNPTSHSFLQNKGEVLLSHHLQQGQQALGLALLSGAQQSSCAKSPQITSPALQGLRELSNVTQTDA